MESERGTAPPMDARPWHALPREVADALRPELPALADDIVAAIAAGVPAYARPLEGRFGVGLRIGVREALGGFLDEIGVPPSEHRGRAVYMRLGRGELRAGRSLDALLAAYRLGARVAWRRLAAHGRAAGLTPDVLYLLAESIFAYIDELSAESVEGFTLEQAAQAGAMVRRRRRLLELIVRDPPAERGDVEAAARDAGWQLPRRVAVLALGDDVPDELPARLPGGVLVGRVGEVVCALVPDPDAPGRRGELERVLVAARRTAALGPSVELAEAAVSFARARATWTLTIDGRLPAEALLIADDHAVDLLMAASARLARDFAQRRLAPLDGCSEGARARLEQTLAAWLDHQGRLQTVAAELGVHPQTVRYRVGQLRERFGTVLEDPDGRFELQLALRITRTEAARDGAGAPQAAGEEPATGTARVADGRAARDA